MFRFPCIGIEQRKIYSPRLAVEAGGCQALECAEKTPKRFFSVEMKSLTGGNAPPPLSPDYAPMPPDVMRYLFALVFRRVVLNVSHPSSITAAVLHVEHVAISTGSGRTRASVEQFSIFDWPEIKRA